MAKEMELAAVGTGANRPSYSPAAKAGRLKAVELTRGEHRREAGHHQPAEERVGQVEVVVGERILTRLAVMGAVVGVGYAQRIGRIRLPHQRTDYRDAVGVGDRRTADEHRIQEIAIAVEIDARRTGISVWGTVCTCVWGPGSPGWRPGPPSTPCCTAARTSA